MLLYRTISITNTARRVMLMRPCSVWELGIVVTREGPKISEAGRD